MTHFINTEKLSSTYKPPVYGNLAFIHTYILCTQA